MVIVETVDLLDSFDQVAEVEAEGVGDVVHEALVVALKDSLTASEGHDLNHLS